LAVCGGGVLNTHLMARLQAACPALRVMATDAVGLPALQVEAAAFAWLARQALRGWPGNLPSVTGAAGPRVRGAVSPAALGSAASAVAAARLPAGSWGESCQRMPADATVSSPMQANVAWKACKGWLAAPGWKKSVNAASSAPAAATP